MLNTSISLCLSHWTLQSWLTKSRVLFIVCDTEGNLRSGLTSVGWAHTVSRVSLEPSLQLRSWDPGQLTIADTVRAPARALSRDTLVMTGLYKTRGASISVYLRMVALSSCLVQCVVARRLLPRLCYFLGRRYLSMSAHSLVPKIMY